METRIVLGAQEGLRTRGRLEGHPREGSEQTGAPSGWRVRPPKGQGQKSDTGDPAAPI